LVKNGHPQNLTSGQFLLPEENLEKFSSIFSHQQKMREPQKLPQTPKKVSLAEI